MAELRLMVDSPATGWREDVDPERISELRTDPANLIWLDIGALDASAIDLLRREFGYHELALEDVANGHQRPKCDAYHDYYFIVIYAADCTNNDVALDEVRLFWGTNYIVTVHDRVVPCVEEARKRWARHDERREHGIGFLAYTIFDSVVDGYYTVQDWASQQADDIEEAIFQRGDDRSLAAIFQLRKRLLEIRRLLGPTRDVLNEIIRRDLPLWPDALRPYFADVYDHAVRVAEGAEVFRDLLSSALDVYLSLVSNRLNQLVKRMTALTLIVMVPTLIAGVYGMNFQRPWPSYSEDWGFAYSMGLMAVTVVGGIILAKWADWL